MVLIFLCFACAHGTPEPDAVPPPAATAETPAATPDTPVGDPMFIGEADANGQPTPVPGADVPTDPKTMYASCKVRVEGEEKAGECATDADCATAGCSHEVCVTTAAAANVNTMCDVQPCFAVLDHCGCSAGLCNWSIKNTP